MESRKPEDATETIVKTDFSEVENDMRRRKITKEEAEYVIENYEYKLDVGLTGTLCFGHKQDGTRLKVEYLLVENTRRVTLVVRS